jgi:hypothetical protein
VLDDLVQPRCLLILDDRKLEDFGGFLDVRGQLPLGSGQGKDVLDEELDIHRQRILGVDVVLEEGKEVVQLLSCSAFVKEHAASFQDGRDQADAEEVVRLVEGVDTTRHWRAPYMRVSMLLY